jgi:hypothetical protein
MKPDSEVASKHRMRHALVVETICPKRDLQVALSFLLVISGTTGNKDCGEYANHQ